MPLRVLLKRKEKIDTQARPSSAEDEVPIPTFKIVRTTTYDEEELEPPDLPASPAELQEQRQLGSTTNSQSGGIPSGSSQRSSIFRSKSDERVHGKRLSARFGLRRSGSESSTNLPEKLPAIQGESRNGAIEAQWEQRAMLLAKQNGQGRSRSSSPKPTELSSNRPTDIDRVAGAGDTSTSTDSIQEAIRLHEAGQLIEATRMFGRLADPAGVNNALSQVLYGLALRHGWGCGPQPEQAVQYLSMAASNAAAVEELALQAGQEQGGAMKGELVLAIFELANSLRHGWGIKKDAVAAKQYYETCANLGDTDAMNETAWCYVEGFGCKKDKFAAARYYRMAEGKGSKIIGNTWIWKEKYDT